MFLLSVSSSAFLSVFTSTNYALSIAKGSGGTTGCPLIVVLVIRFLAHITPHAEMSLRKTLNSKLLRMTC